MAEKTRATPAVSHYKRILKHESAVARTPKIKKTSNLSQQRALLLFVCQLFEQTRQNALLCHIVSPAGALAKKQHKMCSAE